MVMFYLPYGYTPFWGIVFLFQVPGSSIKHIQIPSQHLSQEVQRVPG